MISSIPTIFAQASQWDFESPTTNLHVHHKQVIQDSDAFEVVDVERAHEMSEIRCVRVV